MEMIEDFMKRNFTEGPMGLVLSKAPWDETLLKLKALCASNVPQGPSNRIIVSNMEIDFNNPFVLVGESVIRLTMVELQILSTLVEKANEVVTRELLLQKIWQGRPFSNNIDTHMSNLRRKLRGFRGEFKTIKRLGYILVTK